jgi:hypothetical protein
LRSDFPISSVIEGSRPVHVTKIVVILPALAYVAIRGVMLPLKRGVAMKQLFPIRFLAITFICFMADTVKVLIFSMPKRKHDYNLLEYAS